MSLSLKYSRKWTIDLSNTSRRDREKYAAYQYCTDLPSPPGFTTQSFQSSSVSRQDRDTNIDLLTKRNWDIALAPFKSLPMNLFVMWMAGNSISLFPIMMVGMMAMQPIRGLLSIHSTWKALEGPQVIPQTCVYILGNFAAMAIAAYKCQTMGLLPTHASDWLLFAQPLQRLEWSGGGFALS